MEQKDYEPDEHLIGLFKGLPEIISNAVEQHRLNKIFAYWSRIKANSKSHTVRVDSFGLLSAATYLLTEEDGLLSVSMLRSTEGTFDSRFLVFLHFTVDPDANADRAACLRAVGYKPEIGHPSRNDPRPRFHGAELVADDKTVIAELTRVLPRAYKRGEYGVASLSDAQNFAHDLELAQQLAS